MSFNRHNEARSIERRHALGVIGWFSPGNDRRLIPCRATVSTSPSEGGRWRLNRRRDRLWGYRTGVRGGCTSLAHDVVVGSFASCLKVTKLGHFGARRRRGASSQAKVVTDDEGQEVPRVLLQGQVQARQQLIVSAVYVAAITLPILFPRCPYRTPISSIHLFPTSPTNIMEEINHRLRCYLVMLHIPVVLPHEKLPLPPRRSPSPSTSCSPSPVPPLPVESWKDKTTIAVHRCPRVDIGYSYEAYRRRGD
ncbi:uncharacterized protein ARMOST_08161 [Armillaria ostoyae]|uniref:Uncharacterized protein n=1 Tax=Armillaria ostoyae TaxID=47428 RepID=A0A284R7T2_ARMOS|nr:uncharacterized protein ARMOST_08161 [Armillaria ostoyae]